MLKRLLKKRDLVSKKNERELLKLELAEIEEISDKLFRRIDERVRELKFIELRVDEKTDILEKLLNRAEEAAVLQAPNAGPRQSEVHALAGKGLKIDEIARIFDMPKGEVELILSLEGKAS